MPPLSVVIITYNEERNVDRCLRSVADLADDIVVVDSFSTDQTETICRRYPHVRFLQHAFEGHIEQKNWALQQARYDHVLSLDADEALSPELAASVQQVKENWQHDGYAFNRLTNFCGRWIRHGGWYPDRKLRLWDRRRGAWGGTNPHDRFLLRPGSTQQRLRGDLLHYSFYTIAEHVAQGNKFTDIQAQGLFAAGKKGSYLQLFGSPLVKFVKSYLLKGGFRDGFSGLVISLNSAHFRFLRYSKLRALHRAARQTDPTAS